MEDPSLKWPANQQVLVILAHPDDPEFFCGATLARWARNGHQIDYVLITCGDKGINDHVPHSEGDELCKLRFVEQRNAADVIGVSGLEFLDVEDGMVAPTIALRREIVRKIRQHKPDVIVTCDPQYLFTPWGINHPDHRAAGQVTIDAIFPAGGNKLFFPELLEQGLEPHSPKEVWVSLTGSPNLVLDVSETFEIKMEALRQHASQIGDYGNFRQRMQDRMPIDPQTGKRKFEERFHVINWR